jgi:hypothetical protein
VFYPEPSPLSINLIVNILKKIHLLHPLSVFLINLIIVVVSEFIPLVGVAERKKVGVENL